MRGALDERLWLVAAIVALACAAWAALWQGAGMGMRALDMTVMALFPHLRADPSGAAQSAWILVGMWAIMMVAMMAPAALPLVLLGARVMRHHGREAEWRRAAPFLAAGYLACWTLFAVAAGLLQKALEPAAVVSPMLMWSRSATFSAAVLVLAGIWQLSPLKDACLTQCRAPAAYLQRHWRAGRWGAFSLGLRHGAYCVGCCWLLMALLFVFGVMNVVWIAALSIFVLAEKLTRGPHLARVSAVVLFAWAAATMVVPQSVPVSAQGPAGSYTAAKVLSVDAAQGTVELMHGEIPDLGMPAMTMQFRVRDPRLLEQVRVGDEVRFRARSEEGGFYVTDLRSP